MKFTLFILLSLSIAIGHSQKRSCWVQAINSETEKPLEDYFVQVNNSKGDSVASYHVLTVYAYEIELPDTATYEIHAWKKDFYRNWIRTSKPKVEKFYEKETVSIPMAGIGEVSPTKPVPFKPNSAEISDKYKKEIHRTGKLLLRVQHQQRLVVTLFLTSSESSQAAAFRRINITNELKKSGCDIHKVDFIIEKQPGSPGQKFTNPDKKETPAASFKIVNG